MLYAGTREQIERYVVPRSVTVGTGLPPLPKPRGQRSGRAIRTTAVKDGDSYVLNGTKMWITHADYARYGVVYARTENGISAFVVDAGTPGMTVVRSLPVMRDHWPCELALQDCRIPAENLIGEEGKGAGARRKMASESPASLCGPCRRHCRGIDQDRVGLGA